MKQIYDDIENKQQFEITDFPKRSIQDIKLENLASRIENCKFMPWASLVCRDCGRVALGNATKLSCLSPYCQCSECIKNRKRLTFAYLRGLGIKKKKVIHIIFGFPRVEKFTKEVGKEHTKILNKVVKSMEKLGTPLRMVQARDMNGFKGDLYVHYHCLALPVKDFRMARRNLFTIQSKMNNFAFDFKGYRNRLKMYKYISKRVAGVFQNDGDTDSQSFGYDKLMDLKEFFECIYKTRKIKLYNLSPPRQKARVLALLLDNSPFRCKHCGGKEFDLVPNDQLTDFMIEFEEVPSPPPPQIDECVVEYRKF